MWEKLERQNDAINSLRARSTWKPEKAEKK